jgi:multiple sugar transport system substrate-binding protein
VTSLPWSSAHDKFVNAVSAKQTPDLAMVGTTWMGEMVGLGALEPIPVGVDGSVFFPGAFETTKVRGASYVLPWYVETRLVFVRKDLADKAGITSEAADWDGLKLMAKAMKEKAGAKFGINLPAGGTGSWQTIMPFGWSAGAKIMTDEKTFGFDSPQMLEAVSYYQSYFTDGLSEKAPTPGADAGALFADGSQPMFISGPWMMSAVEKAGVAGVRRDADAEGHAIGVVRGWIEPGGVRGIEEPRRGVEAGSVARQARGSGEVVRAVERPSARPGRLGRRQSEGGRQARHVRDSTEDGLCATLPWPC